MTSSKINRAPTASHAAAQPAEESVGRGNQSHVGRHRLDDDACHPLVQLGNLVVGNHDRLGDGTLGDTCRIR